jgi:hypothetical protein
MIRGRKAAALHFSVRKTRAAARRKGSKQRLLRFQGDMTKETRLYARCFRPATGELELWR